VNYQANIIQIGKIEERPDLKTINKATVLMDVELVVGKDIKEGDVVVYFEPDTAVSVDLLSYLNLFADRELNRDNTKKGYVHKTCCVKAIELQKIRSQGMIIPISDFIEFCEYYKLKTKFSVGESFDHIGDFKICERYVSQAMRNYLEQEERRLNKKVKGNKTKSALPKSTTITDCVDFDKHLTTAHWRHARSYLKVGDKITITSKVHGTSARSGLTEIVKTTSFNRTIIEKVLNFFNKNWFPKETVDSKWDFVTGTRNIVVENKQKDGFHGKETFRHEVTEQLKPALELLSQGGVGGNEKQTVVIYGEIFGFVNGKPIMSTHGTSCLPKEYQDKYGETITYSYNQKDSYGFKIYRVVVAGEDLSPRVINTLFDDKYTFEILHEEIFDGDFDRLGTIVKQLTERPELLTEDYIDSSMISEGVIVRADREGSKIPILLKSKSWAFCLMEGIKSHEGFEIEDVS